jgi:hypothetical protein
MLVFLALWATGPVPKSACANVAHKSALFFFEHEAGIPEIDSAAAASATAIRSSTASRSKFDSREFRKRGIDEAHLSAGAVVRYKEVSVWQRRQWLIIGILSGGILQSFLTAGLLYERLWRKTCAGSLDERLPFETMVADVSAMRCVAKTTLLANRTNRQSLGYRLFSFQSEDFPDELNLPKDIPFRQPPHLAFPDHVQNLIALNRPPGSIE